MNEQLLIELPYELKQQLIYDANRFGISLGDWILRLINKSYSINSTLEDPILPLLGTLQAESNDIGKNHDFHLSQILVEEVELARN